MKFVSKVAYPVGTLVAVAILWEAGVVVFGIPAYLVPPLRNVLRALVENVGLLGQHTATTLYEVVVGFGITLAIGLPLSVAIAAWRPLDRFVFPILVALQTTPKVAIAPLLVVWMGFGIAPKIFMVVVVAIFPLIISSVAGFKSTPLEMVNLGRSMGLRRRALFNKIVLPYALPQVLAGVKVAITLAVIGAVIGEFVGAESGLGYLLISSLSRLELELMFADLLVLVFLGIALFGLVTLVERLTIPWHVSQRRDETHQVSGLW